MRRHLNRAMNATRGIGRRFEHWTLHSYNPQPPLRVSFWRVDELDRDR